MNADEYDPSGEPDIISKDDQLLLNFFKRIEEGKEGYGFGERKEDREEYEELKKADVSGLTEDELDGYYVRLNELRMTLEESYSKEEYVNEPKDIFTWISQSLGLKPRKQVIYGPKEINRPKEKPRLCSPSEIYDHESGKCIPKYMAPWRLRNESYAKESNDWIADDIPSFIKGLREDLQKDGMLVSEDDLITNIENKYDVNRGIASSYLEDYYKSGGESYSKEDYGESKDKCMTCGKVFDVADNDGIIAHVRKHKEERGDNYEPDFKGVTEEKSNPKMGNLQRIADIYHDMERIVDPDMTGDLNTGYGQSMIRDMAEKHNLSEYQIQEIWDSAGTTDIDVSNEEYSSVNESDDLSDWNPKTLKDKILGPSLLPGADWVTKKILGEQYSNENKKDDISRIKSDIERSETPETYEDLDRWADSLGVSREDYHKVFEEGGYMYEDEYNTMYGDEKIIEKKFTPPKILYYKQYKLGRRANVKSHFGNEVSIERLREVEKWWGQVRANQQGHPQWKDMNIIKRQRAIIDFLHNAPTHESYSKEKFYEENAWECSHDDIDDPSGRGDYQCKICGASQRTMNAYADMKGDAMAGKLDKFEKYSGWSDVEKQGYDYIKDQYDFSKESYAKTVYQRIVNEVEGNESYAKEYMEIEEWWTRLGNSRRLELLEKHGYDKSSNFYEDWRFEDLPDTLQDGLSVGYYNDDGSVNESKANEVESCASCGKTEDKYGKQHDKDWRCEKCEMENYFDNEFSGEGYDNSDVRFNQFGKRYNIIKEDLITHEKEIVFSHPIRSRAEGFLGRLDNNSTISYFTIEEESKAGEGGRGSGKRGHSGWMRSLEEASDYKECPHCKVMTEQYGGKCQLCGKKV